MNNLEKQAMKRLDELVSVASQNLSEEQNFKADPNTKVGRALIAIYEAQTWISVLQEERK